MKKILLAVALLITVSGFAQVRVKNPGGTTQAFMYENKDFVNHEFNKVLIWTGVDEGDTKWDEKIIKEFDGLHMKLQSAMPLFPPLKEYTKEDEKKICEENKADGLIAIHLKSSGLNAGGEIKAAITLELIDVATGLKAVYFSGSAIGFSNEKCVVKFIKVVLPDLKRVMMIP